jgi:hypothetical protein
MNHEKVNESVNQVMRQLLTQRHLPSRARQRAADNYQLVPHLGQNTSLDFHDTN